ncbi:ImmA/IrrE family metallo-endopeptidase [Chitinophaga lutea]|uniref:ImmA/IrrE family metallo-endopeptidase n=1 Tax=Chitinophaga lutea TaxID=2488634 RepID=A0A3N4PNI2_9BACT|nr:XRE family transcriptional regulator [Chitinophaga lutea]RPE08199.1 ImmA/IrrE family metallo-endopeptidase [Chitinophaga lutea]
MRHFNAEILKLARESRFLTQTELSIKLGVEQGTVSKIENETLSCEESLAAKISEVLDYPISFFYQERKVFVVEGHYRRKLSTSVKKMKQYVAQMTLAEWHFWKLIDAVELPPVNLPKWDINQDGGANIAAKYVRDYWKIPKGRVSNLTKFVEDNGIPIIQLELGELDALSTFIQNQIPVIFINKSLPADRYRLTIAHELGHLVMHFGAKIENGRDLESEAYQFAIELLMPENEVGLSFQKLTIEKLANLKAYWYISMQALLKYANTLTQITPNQYKYLWIQMGTLGYRKSEPVSIPKEKPLLISEIIETYTSDLDYSKEELAKLLMCSMNDLERLYFDSIKLRVVRK